MEDQNVKEAGFALILGVLASAIPATAASSDKDKVDTAVAEGSFKELELHKNQ